MPSCARPQHDTQGLLALILTCMEPEIFGYAGLSWQLQQGKVAEDRTAYWLCFDVLVLITN